MEHGGVKVTQGLLELAHQRDLLRVCFLSFPVLPFAGGQLGFDIVEVGSVERQVLTVTESASREEDG